MTTVSSGIVLIGGAGYALAVNDVARWVVVIAAVAAATTGWLEGRHIAAVKRAAAVLPVAPRQRRPIDDNPQFFAGS